MSKSVGKDRRLRLDPDSYGELHHRILKRDGWRCQACGRMRNLQVHHLQFRSHSGSDSELNLITYCADCHMRAHRCSRPMCRGSRPG